MKIIIIPVSYCYKFLDNDRASERFRCNWWMPHLNADKYDGTQNLNDYDVIIYSKAHSKEMIDISYRYRNKIQIFDSCDPEFLFWEGKYLKDILPNVSFMTVPTESLAINYRRLFQKSVHVIPDRHNLDYYKIKKEHVNRKPELVWFGYSENFDRIRPLLPIINVHGLELTTICEKPVEYGKFVKWNLDTVNEEIIKGDIVLNLPDKYGFKSNNKSVTGWLLNMPVVEKVSDIFRFLDVNERIKESNEKYEYAKKNYDVKLSIKEILKLIEEYEKV